MPRQPRTARPATPRPAPRPIPRPLDIQPLRPGLLVVLKTSVTGNVNYVKNVIEPHHEVDGVERAKWETTREIADPEEQRRAWAVQLKVRSLITAVCTNSAFGLLCPEVDAQRLARAISEARAAADTFNRTAALNTVRVYIMTGRISQDDVEAVRAIAGEVRGLIDDMREGVTELSVTKIRKAATKAKSIGAMLSPEVAERIEKAVAAGRGIARKIVAAGEGAAVEIDRATIRQITEARTTFLDIERTGEVSLPPIEVEGHDIELADAPPELAPTPLEEAIERATPATERRQRGRP